MTSHSVEGRGLQAKETNHSGGDAASLPVFPRGRLHPDQRDDPIRGARSRCAGCSLCVYPQLLLSDTTSTMLSTMLFLYSFSTANHELPVRFGHENASIHNRTTAPSFAFVNEGISRLLVPELKLLNEV